MLNYPSISQAEITKAYNAGMATLAELAVQEAMQKFYSVYGTICEPANTNYKNCLYLYLYALDTWDETEGAYNFIEESDLLNILTKIEDLNKICCSSAADPVEELLPPTPPLVSNGTWVEQDVSNPATIAELAIATTGTLLWYTVSTGGTGTSVAPNMPDNAPGLYHYWVSQTNANGESRRLPVDVTITPQAIGVSDYIICQSLTPGTHNMVFTGLDMGGVLNVYLNNVLIGTGLTVDQTVVQNVSYTVTQTVVGLESVPTPFTVIVRAAPVTGSSIIGEIAPKVNETKTYTIAAITGATSYTWTLPSGATGSSTTNSINITWTGTGAKVLKVKGVSAVGCIGNEVSLNVTVSAALLDTFFTTRSDESFASRIYSVRQHIQANPTDIVTITSTVLDNPVGATINVTPLAITAVTTDIYTTVTVNAAASYTGGTVIVRLTIVSSSLGATIGTPSVVDLSIPFASEPHCPTGYTLSMDGTYCFKNETMAPTITSSSYCLAVSRRVEYAQLGTRIYNPGFANTSIHSDTPPPADIYATMLNVPQWRGNDGTNGPMNRDDVWIDSNCDGTKDDLAAGQQVTLAFAYTNVGAARTVYVGLGGDNEFVLKVNGTVIADASGTYPAHFKYWHIFPVTILSGTNYFNVVATGDGSVDDSVAMVIYDNTAAQIQAAMSDAALTILFRTSTLVGGTVDVATCNAGWSLDTTGGPGSYICRRTLTTPPII